jgi:hypothetical protein
MTMTIGRIEPILKRRALIFNFSNRTVWACFGFTYYGVILLVARVFQTGEGGEAIDATDEYTAGECSFNYQAIFISATSEIVGVVVTGPHCKHIEITSS